MNMYHELDKELATASYNQLLELFEREERNYGAACVEYIEQLITYTPSQKEEKEQELQRIYDAKARVAIVLAELVIHKERAVQFKELQPLG